MANSPVESLDYFLTTTKQVRRRLDLNRQVPTDVVLECIDLASRAPIGGNLERTGGYSSMIPKRVPHWLISMHDLVVVTSKLDKNKSSR